MPEETYKRHFVTFGYAVIITAIIYAVIYAAIRFMLPFVIAWFVALLFQPLIRLMTGKSGKCRRLAGALVLLLIVALGTFAAGALVSRAMSELKGLVSSIGENPEGIVGEVSGTIEKWLHRLHITTPDDPEFIKSTASDVLRRAIGTLSSWMTGRAGAFFMRLPEILFVLVVFLMALFYLISDFDLINRSLSKHLPERAAKLLSNIKSSIFSTAVKYFKAYMIILLITFSELLVAFMILKIRYALLLAALIALLDLLPAIGVGTVMVPWAVICFVSGRAGLGTGLIIAFIIITVVREVSESHIIGAQLGIPAVLTLLSVYVGFRAAGIAGMIIGPFVALLIKNSAAFLLNIKKENKPAQSG